MNIFDKIRKETDLNNKVSLILNRGGRRWIFENILLGFY